MKDNTVLITIIYTIINGKSFVINDNMAAVFINRDLLQISMLASDVTQQNSFRRLVTSRTSRYVTSRTHLLNNTQTIRLMSDSGSDISTELSDSESSIDSVPFQEEEDFIEEDAGVVESVAQWDSALNLVR